MRRIVSGIGGLVVAISTLTGVMPIDAHVARAAAPVAAFDWSMPSRYGLDHDHDGLIDSFVGTTSCDGDGPCVEHPPTSQFPTVPGSWHVDLNACTSSAADDYQWNVLGASVTVQQRPGGGCDDFYAEFPAEGTYPVDLRVHANGVWGPWTRLDVVVQDWLIVSMGDSYGAGEGSPDIASHVDFTKVADAFAGLGGALADLADVGPCGPVGFDFDACVDVLNARGDEAIDVAASDIKRLDNAVCDFSSSGFDAIACAQLLIEFGLNVVGQAFDAIAGAATDLYNTYVDRFEAVYDQAAGVVDAFQQTIDDFRRSAEWQDRRCHRSANAGSALAAQQLEAIDPHTSVTFVHVACTGAMIFQGMLKAYAGAEDEVESSALPAMPPQIEQAADAIGDREIDIVQLSIGGNDVNFGPMIFSCILRVDCSQPNTIDDPGPVAQAAAAQYCDQPFAGLATVLPITNSLCHDFFDALGTDPLMEKDAGTLFNLGRNGDPNDPLRPGIVTAYNALDTRLHDPVDSPDHGLGLPVDRGNRVYITEYVNPLRRQDGAVCGQLGDNVIPGLSHDESAWLDSEIVPALNDIVHNSTPDDWNVIGGIVDGFADGHGYCADPDGDLGLTTAFDDPIGGHWIRRLEEAFLTQANKMGAVHPNRSGYRHYAQEILPAWLAGLYDDPAVLGGPRRPDQVPYADAGPARTIDEGSSQVLTNDSFDGDLDPLTFAWSTSSTSVQLSNTNQSAATVRGLDDGIARVVVRVTDSDGSSTDDTNVTVRNVPPSVPNGTASTVEGTAFTGSASYTDPGPRDTQTATVDYKDGSGVSTPLVVSGGSVPLGHTWSDNGAFQVAVSVRDDDGGVGNGTVTVNVANAPPVVGTVTAPIAPVLVGTPVTVNTTFTDAGVADRHTSAVNWGDGTTSAAALTEVGGAGSVQATRAYTVPGIYTVSVSVTDDDGGVGSSSFEYVVVYDPSGGFVTGGGQIDSPAGAYTANPTLSGSANFAFVSKYQKGASVPSGNTSFRFHDADFTFNSTSYDWLVVNGGTKATYKGLGTVNGAGNYAFMLSMVDGDTTNSPDRLRLKVWDRATGAIVYDNQLGAADDAVASTAIAHGSITVSNPKKN